MLTTRVEINLGWPTACRWSLILLMGLLVPTEAKCAEDGAPGNSIADAITAVVTNSAYHWETSVESPVDSRFRGRTTTGTWTAEGITHVTFSFGRRPMHVVIQGDKATVTNRDGGWDTVSLLDQGYRSSGFIASMARSVNTPHVDARSLLSGVESLSEEGSEFTGVLTTDTAKSELEKRHRGDSEIRDAAGSVSFLIEHDRLSRYTIRVTGTVVDEDDGEERPLDYRTTVTIHTESSSAIELPDGALTALKRPVPAPEKRLSEAEETELLGRYGKRDIGVHDPSSIVLCDGRYRMFSTGNLVSSWSSSDLLNWERGPSVFEAMPDWVTGIVPDQRGHFWAPDVVKLGDRYLLYYSVSSFGKNTSAIALATNVTLDPAHADYQWVDHGPVVRSSSGDNFNAIDPAIISTTTGDLWMSFGSYWSGLKLIQLDPATGQRMAGGRMYSLAHKSDIEAPHIVEHDGWFYLFLNWGKCCRGADSTYNIRVGRSRSISGPYLDRDGVDMADGGGTLFLQSDGPFIGPGHANVLAEDNRRLFHCHYYDGTDRGRSRLAIMELTWDDDGWPVLPEAYVDGSGQSASRSLKSAVGDRFKIGVGVSHQVVQQAEDAELIRQHFQIVTPENCMKPQSIHPAEDMWNFEATDRFVNFARENDLEVVGHCLVWAKDDRTDKWMTLENGQPVSREKLLQRIEDHINTVVPRYADAATMWDVVNEAIGDSNDGLLRDSVYSRTTGIDFIVTAFKAAREHDPDALLIYNDYNGHKPGKRDKLIELLTQLKDRGAPVDAYGMQGHFELGDDSLPQLRETFNELRKLDIKVVVSELDIDVVKRGRWWADGGKYREELAEYDPYKDGLPPEIEKQQIQQYVELFQLFDEYSDVVVRVSFWNLHDGQSWLNYFPWKRVNHPLLFDRDRQPKPAFDAVHQSLTGSRTTD